MLTDYRDLALEHAAIDHIELVARAENLAAERDAFREMAQVALRALHELTREHGRLRDQHHRLIDEYRALRVEMPPHEQRERQGKCAA